MKRFETPEQKKRRERNSRIKKMYAKYIKTADSSTELVAEIASVYGLTKKTVYTILNLKNNSK